MSNERAVRCPACREPAIERLVGRFKIIECPCVDREDLLLIYGQDGKIKGQIENIGKDKPDG